MTISALKAASFIAQELGHDNETRNWRVAAEQMEKNIGKLFNPTTGQFRKSMLQSAEGKIEYDDTLDASSAYGLLAIGNLDSKTFDNIKSTFSAVEKKLLNSSPSGGVPRFEHDDYFLEKKQYLGNPWIVCTLWQAQYYIYTNQRSKAEELLDWAIGHAKQSGMLSEQIDPETGGQVGVSPLVWSHATFIDTVMLLSGDIL
jgi:GH15 family glucan-1,4-alpha-glucosidase